jgi:hypothetical protein
MTSGLEYVIEIQHNTVKTTPHSYACLLCDHTIKVGKDSRTSTVEMAKTHIKSSVHKLTYLVSRVCRY